MVYSCRAPKEVIAVPSPFVIPCIILLLVFPNGVMNVVTTQSVAHRRTIHDHVYDDKENTITAFGSAEEAAAASTTPFDSFANPKQLSLTKMCL